MRRVARSRAAPDPTGAKRSPLKQRCATFPIHELFEQQAEKTPERSALLCRGERVTFAGLNHRANKVARALEARGVKQETLVGLCLERSIDAIAALIGILKAGGAYVYLDPTYPPRRLREMAHDAGLSVVVTNAEFHRKIFGKSSEVAVLEPDSEEIHRQSGGNLGVPVSLDSAAYVIYTSGSTGRPKGAVEIHRSMTSRLISIPLPDIQPGDVCCLNSSLSFGITASRLFFPLVQGAPVVVLEEEGVKDVRRFAQSLDENGITSVFMAPALLRRVLQLCEEGVCRLGRLRTVTVTGATLTADLIRSFRRLLPSAILINVYGSTETGTTAAIRVHDTDDRDSVNCIGIPAANTRIYILDSNLNQVGTGETGEICVASRNLAREYLNLPVLTAERFIPDPFGKPGERLCRTGDLGRRLPDGKIQFRGRADHQVKIRGYRVELGEIEAALLEHEHVQDAVVTAPGSGDERRLVAYIVGTGGLAPDPDWLKRSLSQRLPVYMLPSTFVTLPELPLTKSGKVDRHALPEPRRTAAVQGAEPKTRIEKAIARLFSELTNVERVSVRDNFIELGGDSLAAAQLLAGIRGQFGVALPARLVFDHTLGELAHEVGAKMRTHSGAGPEAAAAGYGL